MLMKVMNWVDPKRAFQQKCKSERETEQSLYEVNFY